MTSAVRVIARLDIKGPNVIKGIQFDGHRVVGTPEELAEHYYSEGIDELIFQDTVASLYQRNSLPEVLERMARKVFIPITVAGGIRSVDDIRGLLRAGADKVAINTAAVENPSLLRDAVHHFGAQCIVSSIEVHPWKTDSYEVWTDYGRQRTGLDAFDWVKQVTDLGVGEILLTSVAREGMGRGMDTNLIKRVRAMVRVPVIASGGVASAADVVDTFRKTGVEAVAVASVLHYHACRSVVDWVKRPQYVFRVGKHVDTGNQDWARNGYGDSRATSVTPAGVDEIKRALAAAGIAARQVREAV